MVKHGLLVGLLLLGTCGEVRAEITAYPRVPEDRQNPDFPSVRINGVPVDTVATDITVGYVHFAFSGTVTVEVTAREPIRTFDLSPHRYGIKATAKGNVLSFQLSQPRKLHLTVNALPRFFIFADPPEPNAPILGHAGVYNLYDYGISSSTSTVQTTEIQRAIDHVASQKGTLYVPPGIYLSGELTMKSNLTIYISPGAVLKGTAKLSDFPKGDFVGGQFLYFNDCRNVKLLGRGVVDGQGRKLRLSAGRSTRDDYKMKLVRSYKASDFIIEDIIFRDSGSWGIHPVESDKLRLTNIKLISNTKYDDPDFSLKLNTDGIDPDNCSNVVIENSLISCHDDAICVKIRSGAPRNSENIRCSGNVVWTGKSALKIDQVTAGYTARDVVFENNDIIHADRGITIRCYLGETIEQSKWINNHFEYICDDIKQMNMEIKIQDEGGKGHINNILIKDCIFERVAPMPSELKGLDSSHEINGITFDNLVIGGKKCTSLSDAQINTNEHVRGVIFK